MVVMKGLAITAGSKPTRFAAIGSVQPTSFAMSTVTDMVAHTTAAVSVLMSVLPIIMRSTSMIFTKQRVDSATPQSTAVLISFQITFGASENSSSPRLSARMIVTEAWEPELPPVSISIGMKAVSTTCAARALSKPVMMSPVKVAEIISSASHGMRCTNRSQAEERR